MSLDIDWTLNLVDTLRAMQSSIAKEIRQEPDYYYLEHLFTLWLICHLCLHLLTNNS
jgi:hypothetical protein